MSESVQAFHHTKIVATLGPATDSPERLKAVIGLGVDLIRLNMAHATPDWCHERIARIREVSTQVGRHVAVMMDVKGPEIRTAAVQDSVDLVAGDTFQFYIESAAPCPVGEGVSVNYPHLPEDVEIGKVILVDSGLIRLEVVDKDAERVHCKVVVGGTLGSKRHINLPGVVVKLPALTEKDRVDLTAGVEAGIDFVALSFVRNASDISELRELLKSLGSRARIIAKIEDQAGVRNIKEIVQASDGIMVARGDLGIEIDYPELPLVQRDIVKRCRREGKPVIIATHLLESMVDSPIPTRAEISDVSNAIREQADAIMLSGETTTGKYPIESIEVMRNMIDTIEPTVPNEINQDIKLREPKSKMLRSAVILAQELGDESGIVVFTRSGFLAYVLGAMRAKGVPVFAFTDDEVIFRQLLFPWGVEPFLMPFDDDRPGRTIKHALKILRDKQWCSIGSTQVVITNVLDAEGGIIDSLQLRTIAE
ncbi:MAG: pyruvate kinase [Verrucomicrobiota bacterium]